MKTILSNEEEYFWRAVSDGKKLFAAAAGILNDPQRMETMSQNMAALGIPDATKRIYDTVMTLLK